MADRFAKRYVFDAAVVTNQALTDLIVHAKMAQMPGPALASTLADPRQSRRVLPNIHS